MGLLTDSARVVVRITTGPHSDLDHHGRLRILVGLCGLRSDYADGLAIDLPDNLLTSPVDGVGVEVIVVARVSVEGSTTKALGISLAKVVGLDLRVVSAQPFPVDLVQIVRLQDGAADNARAGSGLDHVLDVSEHDVEVGGDQRRIALLGDGERGAFAAVVRGRTAAGRPLIRGAFGEVEASRLSQRGVRRTS